MPFPFSQRKKIRKKIRIPTLLCCDNIYASHNRLGVQLSECGTVSRGWCQRLWEMPGQVSIITHCLVNMFNFSFSRVYLLAEIQRFVHFSSTEVIMLLEFTDRHYKYLPPSLTHCEVQCCLAAEDINHYGEGQANVSKPGRACICFPNSLP